MISGAHQSDIDTAALFQDRIGSLVAVEFFIQREIDRQPQEAMGLVVDKDGLVVLLEGALPHWLPPKQFKEFKAYLPGEGGDGYEAEYLGQDYLSGWHYLRVEESVWPRLTPVAAFPVSEPAIGQEIWGIGLLGEEFDYQPYFLRGGLSVVQKLPQRVGFSENRCGGAGGARLRPCRELRWHGRQFHDPRADSLRRQRSAACRTAQYQAEAALSSWPKTS